MLTAAEGSAAATVLVVADVGWQDLVALLAGHGLELVAVAEGASIPGSFWGEPEAGIIGCRVYARPDTPLHSLLHEAAHLAVLPAAARAAVHTDATDSLAEEDAVCVLQSLWGDVLPGVGAARVLADMDAWGYTFRLGSAAAFVDGDAAEAWRWLEARGFVDAGERRLLAPASALAPPSPPH